MMRRLFILTALATCVAASGAGERAEHRFLWDEANARMLSARTPGDALQAAESYARLLDSGVRNGALFYNMGTALLLAGRDGDAIKLLLRAERYEGARPDARHNLRIAIARQEKHGIPGAHWPRILLFWHYQLPAERRGLAAAAAFFVFWLALTARQRRRAPGAMLAAALALAVFFVLGMSFAATLYQEAVEPIRSFSTAPR